MYPSVLSAFRAFNEPFEGWVPYMYLDIKGLVTVGLGNLIDPVDQATILPFRFKDTGALASAEQIAAEWRRIKDEVWLAKKGHTDAGPLTRLELNADAVDALVAERLNRNESYLMRQPPFQQFTAWPADAQMALLSMAWAMGPAGPQKFTRFCAACVNLDFRTAAAECRMNETGNPGLTKRNIANRTLLLNAAVVASGAPGLHAETLYYPRELPLSIPAVIT